jgi:hypothetical protein
LAFSWIRLNLGFLLREKLAAMLIIPSSWGFQLDSDLHQHTVPHHFVAEAGLTLSQMMSGDIPTAPLAWKYEKGKSLVPPGKERRLDPY